MMEGMSVIEDQGMVESLVARILDAFREVSASGEIHTIWSLLTLLGAGQAEPSQRFELWLYDQINSIANLTICRVCMSVPAHDW